MLGSQVALTVWGDRGTGGNTCDKEGETLREFKLMGVKAAEVAAVQGRRTQTAVDL